MATRSTQSAYDIEMIRQERDAARAELAALRATVAALTKERDAAYSRGWDEAREAAAVYLDSTVLSDKEKEDGLSWADHCPQVFAKRIRALQPPTAPTEHDAAKLRSLIDYTKSKPQSQASLRDQLNALIELANINGLYDAADFVAGRNK